jgi:DHA2 family metal-tetracycline-proton antiporter-like MFS transporter
VKAGGEAVYALPNERIIYAALQFNVLITVMNTTMFNVALPNISTQFSLSPSLASWVVMSYSVIFAIGTVTYGRLADQFPLKTLFTVGLLSLGIGSIIGMISTSFSMLIVARLIQALGASSIPGIAMVLTARFIPLERRGAAMGKITAAATLGFGLGPMLGGIFTEYMGWTSLFFITFIAVFMLPIYRIQLPKEQRKNLSFDSIGLGYMAVGVVSMLLWITSGVSWFGLGAICFFLLWRHIQRVEQPFISKHLLVNRDYMLFLITSSLIFFTNFSVMFTVPLLLFQIHGLSAAMIGAVIFPGAICSSLASLYIGKLLDQMKAPVILVSGICLMLVAIILFSSWGFTSHWWILLFYFISNIGFAAISTAIPREITILLAKDDIGVGMGFMQLVQFFGGAFGVASTGMILDFYAGEKVPLNPFWTEGSLEYSYSFSLLLLVALLALLVYIVQWRGSRVPVTE